MVRSVADRFLKIMILVWAMVNIALIGKIVLDLHLFSPLKHSPSEIQATIGDDYTKGIIASKSFVNFDDHKNLGIYFVDENADVGLKEFEFFWATYWLYPKKAEVFVPSNKASGVFANFNQMLVLFPPTAEVSAEEAAKMANNIFPDARIVWHNSRLYLIERQP